MLENLDDIPWKDLSHAYGSAEDVPELLRGLRDTSPVLKDDESALYQLFGNIWHQGTIYEATAHAVPFLIELAGYPDTPDRVGILTLVASIASGTSYLEVHQHMFLEKPDDLEPLMAEELLFVKNAHDAVARDFDSLIELTRTNSPEINFASAYTLARIPGKASIVRQLVENVLQQQKLSTSFRIGYIMLLGRIDGGSDTSLSILAKTMRSSDDDLLRAAAAISMARLQPECLSEAEQLVVQGLIYKYAYNDIDLILDGSPLPDISDADLDALKIIAARFSAT